MNTEQRQRAEALLKEKWAWCPFDPKYFPNFIDVMIDFHNQELSRIGEVYVPVSVEDYLPPKGDIYNCLTTYEVEDDKDYIQSIAYHGDKKEFYKSKDGATVTHWLKKLNLSEI